MLPLLPFVTALAVSAPVLNRGGLEWNFIKGKSFYQTTTSWVDQTMKVAGTETTSKQEHTWIYKWDIVDVNRSKNTVKLRQKIVGVKVNIDLGGSKISYDSTIGKGNDNAIGQCFEPLVNTEFTLTLNTREMKVVEFSGHEALIKKFANASPQMKPMMEKILTKSALSEMAESLFAAMPGPRVSKGSTWTRSSVIDTGIAGRYEVKDVFTHNGKDKDHNDRIAVKTEMKHMPATDQAGGGLPFRIKESNLATKDATGTVLYDNKAHRVRSYETNRTLTGTMTIEIGQQDSKIELKQTQKTIITISDKDPLKK